MKKAGKIFWGLFFIAAAAFIIIGKLGWLEEYSVFKLVLSAFLVAVVIKSTVHLNYAGMFFPIAILLSLYDELLKIESLTPWPVLGAALLLTIGCYTLFGHKHWKWNCGWNSSDYAKHCGGVKEVFQNTENSVHYEKSFGESINYVNSDNFEYADFDCSFGSMKVYFDNAVIQKGNATIHLDVSFGGIELYFPRSWRVINNADCSFGAVNEKNRGDSTGVPTVTLTGSVNFGAATIFYV